MAASPSAPPTAEKAAFPILPERLPEDVAPAREPLFRSHPEVLYSVVAGMPPGVLEILSRPLGLRDPTAWEVYDRLLVGTEAEFEIFVERAKEDFRDFMDAMRDGRPSRFLNEAELRRLARQMEQEWEEGTLDYGALMAVGAGVYLARSGKRHRLIKAISPILRRVVLGTYPERDPERLRREVEESGEEALSIWAQQLEARERRASDAERRAHQEHERAVRFETQLERTRMLLERAREELTQARRALLVRQEASQLEESAEPQRSEAEDTLQELREELGRTRILLRDAERRKEEAEKELAEVIGGYFEQRKKDIDEAQAIRTLAGKRVLIIGGLPKKEQEMRDTLESYGMVFIHEDANQSAALDKLRSADVVVFATRHMSHPELYWPVKAAAKQGRAGRAVPVLHWEYRAPHTLVQKLLEEVDWTG